MITLNCPACGAPFEDETVLGASVKMAEHMGRLPETEHIEQLHAVKTEITRLIENLGARQEMFDILAQFDARLRGIQFIVASHIKDGAEQVKALMQACQQYAGISRVKRGEALQRQLTDALRIVEIKIR